MPRFLQDYFLPASRGWEGRSLESSFLLSAHFNNSQQLPPQKCSRFRVNPVPLDDHQLGGELLGGVACHLPQVGLHPGEEPFANTKLLRGEVGEVGGK